MQSLTWIRRQIGGSMSFRVILNWKTVAVVVFAFGFSFLSFLAGLIENHLGLPRILDLQRLGRFFVRVGVENLLNLVEDGVQLLPQPVVLSVVGLGGDVSTEVIPVIQGELDGLVGGRVPNGIGDTRRPGTSRLRRADSVRRR